MPSMTRQRHVGFEPTPTVSRQPSEGEANVMRNFARHASHCEECRDPFLTHSQNKTLCDRGHHHARNVAEHLFNKEGRTFSTKDGPEYQAIQIEIPHKYDAVRGLLKAIESGLRLRRARSAGVVVSYDKSYYVAPRRASTSQRQDYRSRVQIVEPPRGHHDDGKVIYIKYDGTPYQRSPEEEDGMIILAGPQSRPRRRDSVGVRIVEERFHR